MNRLRLRMRRARRRLTFKPPVTAEGPDTKAQTVLPTPSIKLWMSMIEIAMGLYTLNCARLAADNRGALISIPFLLLFTAGYLYVGIASLKSQWQTRQDAAVCSS